MWVRIINIKGTFVISLRLRKILVIALGFVSFVALSPLSMRIADPLFTRAFDPRWKYPILLVWPDRIEVRWVRDLSEVSPRPKGETYTFNVPPDRQAWIEEQVRKISYPQNPDLGLSIKVKQLGPERQQIQLEAWKDGFVGLIYEARPDGIIPLRSRIAGLLGAIPILGVHLLVWAAVWFGARLIWRSVIKVRLKRAPAISILTA